LAAYVSDDWLARWPAANPWWHTLGRLRQVSGPLARLAEGLLGRAGLLPDTRPAFDRYFYCSDFMRRTSRHRGTPGATHQVVPWGLDPVGAAEKPADRFDGDGPLTLLYAGQLVEHKGLAVLIEALARCPRKHVLLVAGDDRTGYAARCKRRAAELGVLPQVRFLGKNDHADTLSLLQGPGRVLVVPSVWDEPFSLVVLEGMGAGLPVLASDTGGTAEAVADGATGWLFPRGDTGRLAALVGRLDGDRGLCRRVGDQARRAVRQRFTLAGMADQLLDGMTAFGRTTAGRAA
jgi:glycosyltransferase involved in cell wall biosynthesis